MFTCRSGAAALVLAAAAGAATAAAAGTAGPDLGEPMTAAQIARLDLTVLPDGRGLPPGSGEPGRGRQVFQTHCQACHGADGQGGPNDVLVNAPGAPADGVRTIGSFWPYATTLFDYVRRAMPYQNPGSLSDDDVYAVTAHLLHLNGIITADTRLDANTLPRVRMPNRDAFVSEYPPAPP